MPGESFDGSAGHIPSRGSRLTGIPLLHRSFLTKTRVNSMLPQLLSPHLGPDSCEISGHSFRAAIPAVLARHPDVANSSDIMGWGRWKSQAYLSYTRLKLRQKKDAFSKITNLLNL